MQKELKITLDNFLDGESIQPILISEEKIVDIINYLNKSDIYDIEEIRFNVNPNIYLFETEDKTFKIEKTREIVEKATVKPGENFNIFIIREIDKLSIAASNALLKIFEDVPPRIIFILTTNAKENLIETIKSRILDFGSNTLKFEISDEYRLSIDSFFEGQKLELISKILGDRIEKHEYIAILEYLLVKIKNNNRGDEKLYSKILKGIGDIYSTNTNPKYILDSIILEIN